MSLLKRKHEDSDDKKSGETNQKTKTEKEETQICEWITRFETSKELHKSSELADLNAELLKVCGIKDALEKKIADLETEREQTHATELKWLAVLKKLHKGGLAIIPGDEDTPDFENVPATLDEIFPLELKHQIYKMPVELSLYEIGESVTHGRNSESPDYEDSGGEYYVNGHDCVNQMSVNKLSVPPIENRAWNFEHDSDGELGSHRVWRLSGATAVLLSLGKLELKYTGEAEQSLSSPVLVFGENENPEWKALFNASGLLESETKGETSETREET